MIKHLGLISLIVLSACWPARADDEDRVTEAPVIAFEPVVADALERVIRPGYSALAEVATEEATTVGDLCWQADTSHLDAARQGFRDLVLAWSNVEMFRFGPVRDDNRYERLFFWPDPRGRGLQQVQGILGSEDATAADVDTLYGKSVAVQGLFALEFILFGTGSDALADKDAAARSFRCRYGAAIAGAIARTAGDLSRGWQAVDGYAAVMLDAGDENPVYRSSGEVVQELIKSCREQVQLDQQLKLAFTIGETPGEAKPKLAPFWRSNMTIPSIQANLAAVVSLCGEKGLGGALPKDSNWQAGSLAFELRNADSTLTKVADSGLPWVELAADPKSHDLLAYTEIPLGGAGELLEHGYPDSFGLITGFNSLDGD
ncbi:MAG: peptidase M75, Imelysin [Bauldia sp.]|nr:peptidase M75, Imelysin [Bauldia sp.]